MTKKEKNQKNTRRRLLLLIFLLALTITMLGTGTYAWFTANKKVSVDEIDVDVRAVNGLEISADAENWYVNLTKERLTSTGSYTNINQFPTTLGAVSTVGETYDTLKDVSPGQTNRRLVKFFDGKILDPSKNGGVYKLTTSETVEEACSTTDECAGKRYVAFDIFLKLDSEKDTNLKISAGSGVENLNVDRGVKNAARVGFLMLGHVTHEVYHGEGGIDQARGLAGEPSSVNDKFIVWEPNYNVHTNAAVMAAKQYYGIDHLKTGSENERLPYEGVKTAFSEGVELTETNSKSHPDKFKAVVPSILTRDLPLSDNIESTIVLKPGITKMRVYFWVEGQDVDAENQASGTSMKLNLGLSID